MYKAKHYNKPNLSEAQLSILAHLANGKNAREIAEARNVKYNTVKCQISNLLRKMNATTRSQAVGIAISKGYIKEEYNGGSDREYQSG